MIAISSILIATACHGSSIQVVLPPSAKSPRYTVGLADAEAGTIGETGPVTLPDSNCTPGWVLGDGTRGQTSTSFYVNMTWFLLGQELCGSTVKRTTLFGVFGIFPQSADPEKFAYRHQLLERSGGRSFETSGQTQQLSSSDTPIRWFGDFTKYSTQPLPQWNIVWDWTCNIVVIAPEVTTDTTKFATLQVSEYDLQVRPQPTLLSYDTHCTDCWVKVPGSAALQQQPQTTPPRTSEENCGDQCVLYIVEQYIDATGKTGLLRPRIVGRTYRTGQVVSNITDTVNVQTWTYGSPYAMLQTRKSIASSPPPPFFGIGICCEGAQCSAECAGHDDSLALISYSGLEASVDVLAILPVLSSDDGAATAISLGVIVDPIQPWGPPSGSIAARVFLNQKIYSYALTMGPDGYVASLNGTSAVLETTPIAWNLQRMD